jgi:hypothetical protein
MLAVVELQHHHHRRRANFRQQKNNKQTNKQTHIHKSNQIKSNPKL